MRNWREASGITTDEEFDKVIRGFPVPDEESAHREIVLAAVAARIENERRHRYCMSGLVALVQRGGLPWGVCFGYKRTVKPGFPTKHPAQAKAVKRAFMLGMTLSARETARVLETEGHLSPNGTVNWTVRMVQWIWDCVTYTGHIHYPKTQSVRESCTGRRISCARPSEDQVTAYNPALRIVSDEQFAVVRNALRSRQHKTRPAMKIIAD